MREARVRARARALPQAFLDEIARGDLDARATHAAVAGLIVMRTLDRWVAGGSRPIDAAPARRVVEEMDVGDPARDVLLRTLAAMETDSADSGPAVASGMLGYGRALANAGRWPLASAVYGALAGYGPAVADDETGVLAGLRQAGCLRVAGSLDAAVAVCEGMRAIADERGLSALSLRAEIGIAIAEGHQGKHDQAFRRAGRVAERSLSLGNRTIRAMALNTQAFAVGIGGDHVTAAVLAYRALQESPSPADHDRILHNLGECFRRIGNRAAARDAFLVLSVTACEEDVRVEASIVLMLLSAEDGDRVAFDRKRRDLERMPLCILHQVHFLEHLEAAWSALGEASRASTAGLRVDEFTRLYGIRRSLVRVEPQMESETAGAPAAEQLHRLTSVVHAIKKLRLRFVPE